LVRFRVVPLYTRLPVPPTGSRSTRSTRRQETASTLSSSTARPRKPFRRKPNAKGFEIENGQYVISIPTRSPRPFSKATRPLEIEAFIPCSDVDDVYFDKP
jgi:DNA end-binding protein Ku